jgi:hypothetical protein
LWFASLVLISSIFTLLPLDLLGCACLWVQESSPCLWSSTRSTQELRFLLEVKRRFELSCRFTGQGGLTAPGPGLTAPSGSVRQGRSNRLVGAVWPPVLVKLTFPGEKFYLVVSPIHPPSRRHQGPFKLTTTKKLLPITSPPLLKKTRSYHTKWNQNEDNNDCANISKEVHIMLTQKSLYELPQNIPKPSSDGTTPFVATMPHLHHEGG